jgi:anti-anti-sigma factor
MEININDREDCTIIKFNKSKLLGTEAVEFQDSVLNTLDKGIHSIVVDLSTVEYVTSWAIGMLVHAFTTSSNRNAQFSLVGVTQRVKDILSKVKLDTIFLIRESI